MEQNSIVMSYMVRCCLEPNGCFRVLVRQIASGEERHFTSLQDATDYIGRQMKAAQASQPPSTGMKGET
jgi:hypothetical protein